MDRDVTRNFVLGSSATKLFSDCKIYVYFVNVSSSEAMSNIYPSVFPRPLRF